MWKEPWINSLKCSLLNSENKPQRRWNSYFNPWQHSSDILISDVLFFKIFQFKINDIFLLNYAFSYWHKLELIHHQNDPADRSVRLTRSTLQWQILKQWLQDPVIDDLHWLVFSTHWNPSSFLYLQLQTAHNKNREPSITKLLFVIGSRVKVT